MAEEATTGDPYVLNVQKWLNPTFSVTKWKSRDVKYSKNALTNEHKLIIYNDVDTSCILFFESSNIIRINFRTKLPYKISDKIIYDNKFKKYYLEINEHNYSMIRNKMIISYMKILIIIMCFNLILIIYKSKT